MHNPVSEKLSLLKKVFIVLLVLDIAGLLSAGIALLPTFRDMAGSGTIMLVVFCVLAAGMAAISLFEILAKVFLIKSTSPAFSWTPDRKGYRTAAKFLLVFNLGALILNALSIGGEGATLLNQARLYLQVLSSAAEIVAVVFYLRAVKKH